MSSINLDPSRPLPKLPLPEPICSTTPNTWAYDTMSRRVDEEILQRTFEENQNEFESPEFQQVLERFQALRQKLKSAGDTKLTYLEDLPKDSSKERVREYNEWKELLKPYVEAGDSWLSAPWLITEFYVYRLVMQALGYWDKDSAGYQYDPFAKQKRAGLTSSVASAEPMLTRIPNLPPTKEGIELAAAFALWGNKMDLSLWPADAANQNVDVFCEILEKAAENLLHDDSDTLGDYCDQLRSKGGGNVDIIVDNAGFELVTDLALGQHLVQVVLQSVSRFSSRVTLRLCRTRWKRTLSRRSTTTPTWTPMLTRTQRGQVKYGKNFLRMEGGNVTKTTFGCSRLPCGT